jgi:hypothetical protein
VCGSHPCERRSPSGRCQFLDLGGVNRPPPGQDASAVRAGRVMPTRRRGSKSAKVCRLGCRRQPKAALVVSPVERAGKSRVAPRQTLPPEGGRGRCLRSNTAGTTHPKTGTKKRASALAVFQILAVHFSMGEAAVRIEIFTAAHEDVRHIRDFLSAQGQWALR